MYWREKKGALKGETVGTNSNMWVGGVSLITKAGEWSADFCQESLEVERFGFKGCFLRLDYKLGTTCSHK